MCSSIAKLIYFLIFLVSSISIDESSSTEMLSSKNDSIAFNSNNDWLLANNTNANVPKSRRKRYLAFPEGSSFSVNIVVNIVVIVVC